MTLEQFIELLKEIVALYEDKETTKPAKPTPVKAKGPKKKVEEVEEPELEEAEEEVEDVDDDMSFMEEDEDALTPEDVLKAIHAFIKAQKSVDEGRKKVKALLTKFKAKSVDTLKPENYQAVIDALQVKKAAKK